MMCPQYVFGVSHLYNLGEPFDTTTNQRIQRKTVATISHFTPSCNRELQRQQSVNHHRIYSM